MGLNRFHELVADTKQRVERGQRILKNHGNAFAPQTEDLLFTHLDDIVAMIADLAPGKPSRRPEKPEDGKTQGGFTATGLAHQTHDFSLFQIQGHIFNGMHGSDMNGKMHIQIFDFKNIGIHATAPTIWGSESRISPPPTW